MYEKMSFFIQLFLTHFNLTVLWYKQYEHMNKKQLNKKNVSKSQRNNKRAIQGFASEKQIIQTIENIIKL